ncbi:MAG: hypothetical protein R3F65_21830 [bacterium]
MSSRERVRAELPVLICPKCNRSLAAGARCPVDHGVPGGVAGVAPGELERTPRSKRHLLGLTISDAYVINGYLGSGGFGAVYRAEQKALGRDVALKLLMTDAVNDPAVIRRFRREARTAAALLDPNIVTLFDFGEASLSEAEEDQALWIAMELVVGPTLKVMLPGGATQGLGLEGAVSTGVAILRGLAASVGGGSSGSEAGERADGYVEAAAVVRAVVRLRDRVASGVVGAYDAGGGECWGRRSTWRRSSGGRGRRRRRPMCMRSGS